MGIPLSGGDGCITRALTILGHGLGALGHGMLAELAAKNTADS